MDYIDTGFFVNTSNGCKLHTAFERHPLKQNATVGKRIHHFRSKRGIMIETLAEKSGVSRDAIIRYENGQTEPSPKNLLAIAEVLGVKADKLCDEYYRFLLYPYGKRIKEMRRKLGLTQQEFAEKYEFTIDSIKRWEQGINRVTREQWERLNEILAALVA